MAAAQDGFGSAAVAAVVPLHVEEIDEVGCDVVPLCALVKLKAPAEALELKMRRFDRNEVFQQWEVPEDEPEEEEEEEEEEDEEEELSLLKKLHRGVSRGQINGFNQEVPEPFAFYYRATVQPSRHSANPAVPLLEWSANILSIKVVDSTVGYPINLYGSVFLRDDLDGQRVYLFRRDRSNPQLVKSPEETLVLTGPSRGLLVFDNLFFEFDLKVRRDQDDMDFSQGKMHYSSHSTVRSMLIVRKLETKLSNVEIEFTSVKRAVEATIQINVPKEMSLVFGKISALITGIEKEAILFDSDTSGTIKIKDGGIELCRSIVSVPIAGSLLLRVDTWEGDYKANLSRSATIFTPQLCGEDVASVHSAIQVKVTWSPVYISKFDDKLVNAVIF